MEHEHQFEIVIEWKKEPYEALTDHKRYAEVIKPERKWITKIMCKCGEIKEL